MEVLKKVEAMWLNKDQKGISRNWLVRKFFNSYRKRAGCVVLQKIEDQIMVLLIGSIEKVNCWKLPAGGIEDGETEFVAAARETFEESGVVGVPTEWLDSYKDLQKMTQTFFYLMTDFKLVKEDEYEEGIKGRQRQWFSTKEAINIIPVDQRNALNKAIEKFEKGSL